MVRTVLMVEWGLLIAALMLLITQVLIPAFRGTPFFPLLRSRGLAVESAAAAFREEAELQAREKELSTSKLNGPYTVHAPIYTQGGPTTPRNTTRKSSAKGLRQ